MGVFDLVSLFPSRPAGEIQVRFPRARQRSFSVGKVVPELVDKEDRFFAGISNEGHEMEYYVVLVRRGEILAIAPISEEVFVSIEASGKG